MNIKELKELLLNCSKNELIEMIIIQFAGYETIEEQIRKGILQERIRLNEKSI